MKPALRANNQRKFWAVPRKLKEGTRCFRISSSVTTTQDMKHVLIDGSMLEGGGQILRNSAALGAVTGTSITVENIRAGRSKPGLAAQHLTGLQLVQELCKGSLEGGAVRSTRITLNPGQLTCGTYTADIKTAGSCSLLVQTVLPCLLFARPSVGAELSKRQKTDHPAVTTAAADTSQADAVDGIAPITGHVSLLTLRGGTDAAHAPPVGYVIDVLVPMLQRLWPPHICPSVELIKRGFYPRGGGDIHVTACCLPAGEALPAFELTKPGLVTRVHVHAFTAGRLPLSLASDLAAVTAQEARRAFSKYSQRVDHQLDEDSLHISTQVVHEPADRAVGDGGGLSITIHTSTGCILGANALVDKDSTAQALAIQCVEELTEVLAAGACVDQWMQDQLIIFMALAAGTSRMRCTEPSLHCRTAMVVAEKLTSAKFRVLRPTSAGRAWLIECQGAGITRPDS